MPETRECQMPRVALYHQIADDIRTRIVRGELRPGDQLPSITKLKQRYGVSATPVKQALVVLHIQGFTEGHQGRGVYVIGPATSSAPATDPGRV
jgi:GntR family transcriptional regulator